MYLHCLAILKENVSFLLKKYFLILTGLLTPKTPIIKLKILKYRLL